MPYPSQFLRLAVAGTLYDVEDWTFTLSIVPESSNDATKVTTVSDAVADAVQTFHTGACTFRSRLQSIKLNEIGPAGRYVDDTKTVERTWPAGAGPTGAGTGTDLPPQISLAVTLRTAAGRGLASSGRFYVPVPAVSFTSSGRITESSAITVRDRAVTMINSLNAALPGWRVGVMSDVREGAMRPVTSVQVGTVLDTIRSRRGKFKETYTAPVSVIA